MNLPTTNVVTPLSSPSMISPGHETWDVIGFPVSCSLPEVGFPVSLLVVKRMIDIVGSLLGLIFLLPLLLILAVLVRFDSPGPILFRQRRTGLHGRPFSVLKFRTMCVDAEHRIGELESLNESSGGVLFKMRRDPRITRVGRVLRRTSLDELPQLLNILWGEMSLVGPRPLQLRDTELLKARNPTAYARRLEMPPGLTGAWQVGRLNASDYEDLMRLDLHYLERWSLGLDFKILFQTVYVVLAGRGAC